MTIDLSKSGALKKFNRDFYVKYDVEINEKTAFEWFSKSLIPNYEESLFARFGNRSKSSHFESNSYYELAIIYKEGKVVEKDKQKAKELMNSFKTYKYKSQF